MDRLVPRELIRDEAAVPRRAFLQGTGLLLGFALTGASGVHLRGACRVEERHHRPLANLLLADACSVGV